jgi:hypothetical protein
MTAVRRGAWVGLKYVTTVFFLGVIVQFFLVGFGLFGMKDGQTIDNAKSLDAHRAFGFILADGGALLFLVLALLAWPKPRKLLGAWILLAVLAFLQPALADFHHEWVGMFHPVNALLLLGLSGRLAHYAWTTEKEKAAETVPAAAAGS